MFGTSTSKIFCKTSCGASEFAIQGFHQYTGWCASTFFSSSHLLTVSSLAYFFLSVTSVTSLFLSCAHVITKPVLSFTFSFNSAIAPHTNLSSSSCTASINELNFMGPGIMPDRCGGGSQIFHLVSTTPLSPPG